MSFFNYLFNKVDAPIYNSLNDEFVLLLQENLKLRGELENIKFKASMDKMDSEISGMLNSFRSKEVAL